MIDNRPKEIASQVLSEKNMFERTTSDKIDSIVAQKWIGVLIFALVMYVVFLISQVIVGPFFADLFVEGILEPVIETLEEWMQGASPILISLVIDGILGGISAVVGFLPLIMLLFFLLALLEDSGYMARVAIVMDRFFKKVGLSGKSVIPMYVSTGCTVPGIMSSKTIKNEKQKRTTVLLSPFIPCGAKGPVYLMVFSLLAIGTGWAAAMATLSVYLLSLLIILVTGYIIKALTGASYANDESSNLIIELPEYKIPSLKKGFFDMLSEVKEFLYRAATLLIIANALVWFMSSFTWTLSTANEALDNSILASISKPIAVLLIPLGIGAWQLAAASIVGFIAKEEVVAVLAILFPLTFMTNGDFGVTVEGVEAIGLTTTSALLAFMMFNLYTPPCFAAIGAMNAQLKSRKLLLFGILLQLSIGYLSALVVFQLGHIIETGSLGEGFISGIIVLVIFIGVFLYLKKLGKQGKGLANVDE